MTHTTKAIINQDLTYLPFYDLIYEQVLKNMLILPRDTPLVAEKFINKSIWKLLEKGEHLSIGKTMSQMVEAELLPLIFAVKKSDNAMQYLLR